MADTKITALTAIGANPIIPSTFPIPMVDLTDTSMAASGTTKKVTVNQILQAGGTATLASATITGDLTVDTSTLKVDSANNRVGIGTASPTVPLYVTGNNATATAIMQDETNGAKLRLLANSINFDLSNGGGGGGISVSGNNPIIFQTNGSEQMRLNSTGLGVGGSPNDKLEVVGSGSAGIRVSRAGVLSQYTTLSAGATGPSLDASSAIGALTFGVAGSTKMTVDSSGNVGIGVTPSAPLDVRGPFNGTHAIFTGTVNRGLVIATRSDGLADSRTVIFNAAYSAGQLGQFAFQIAGTDRILMKNNGQLRFVPLASDPAGAEAGDVYYNSTSNKLKCYNGTTWNDLF